MPDEPLPDDALLADALLRAARSLRRGFHTELDPAGLSPHHARALGVVGDDGARISELAAALRIAPRSATEVVDGLAERGLVERTADPADRRAVVVRLTPAGVAARTAAEAARARAATELFHSLDDDERAQLAHLLQRLDGHTDSAGPTAGPDRTT